MRFPLRHIIAGVAMLLNGCMQSTDEPYLKNATFQPDGRILTVDYAKEADTALHQVIALSGIRSSGYGVLVNVDSAVPDRYLSEIREKFKKLDINAVHTYTSGAGGMIDIKTRTAIEGARFTWVFYSDSGWLNRMQISPLFQAMGKSTQTGGILVKGP